MSSLTVVVLPIVQALFKTLTHAVRRSRDADSEPLLGSCLVPSLVHSFQHTSADVRKAVRCWALGTLV
jgi:hypothetical protein